MPIRAATGINTYFASSMREKFLAPELIDVLRNFGFHPDHSELISISSGLINYSISVSDAEKKIFLQRINQHVFPEPGKIVSNYKKIYSHLSENTAFLIPSPVKTIDNAFQYTDKKQQFWRAIAFIKNGMSYATSPSAELAYKAAKAFGEFTDSFKNFDSSLLEIIIPDFHNLSLRYRQFQEALANSDPAKINTASGFIKDLQEKKYLVDFYSEIVNNIDYKQRVMHHDAKLSNILFNKDSGEVICPVDLDTTQPGYYFSDLGDMIRSMVCPVDENSVEFSAIQIRPAFYNALLAGYLKAMEKNLTNAELKNIHYCGLIMIYMQALRYLADFLNGNKYYQVSYPEQNLNRAINQISLLKNLEEFLTKSFLINLPSIR